MDAQMQKDVTKSREKAADLTTGGHLNLAEETHRYVVDTIQQHEGKEATYADRYNLSNVLVMQHKHAEAEPILRDMLSYLAKRPVDDDSGHFLEQEAGTIRMLVRSVKGQGRDDEADNLRAGAACSGREEQLQVRR